MKTGMIFDIQHFSIGDGPGIRTTVFFKGCNLKCRWCQNPESQSLNKEIMFYEDKCVCCGRCENISQNDTNFVCLNGARELCGREHTLNQVMKEIMDDLPFYETSGGVTFSGGECMLQIDFLCEILKKCMENGIHTSVDTAGNVPWEYFERIIPYTDLFLYDIKAMNEEVHKLYTGVTNNLILENLAKLLKSDVDVWVRVPVVTGVNDTEEEMKNIRDFFDKNGYPEKIELLSYHALGENKYTAIKKPFVRFDVPTKETIENLKNTIGL